MAVPLYALNRGYGTASVGILLALFAVAQIAIALPARRLADRLGLKLPLAFCGTLSIMGTTLAALWPEVPALGLSAMCVGGAVGISLVALQRYVGRMAQSDTELRQAYSWLSVAPSVSIFIGPVLAGALIDGAGYQIAFAILGLLPLGSLWTAYRAKTMPPVPAPPGPPASPWSLWGLHEFRQLMLLNWLMNACWDLHAFMVPVLAHERGISASAIGSLMGAFALAATISRLAIASFARRISDWVMVATSVTLAGVFLGSYPLLQALPLMAVCSFVLGLLLGSVQPLVMTLIHEVAPEHRQGDAMAMRLMMVNASGIAMPVLYGSAGLLVTSTGVFHIAGLAVGVTGGFAIHAIQKISHRPRTPH